MILEVFLALVNILNSGAYKPFFPFMTLEIALSHPKYISIYKFLRPHMCKISLLWEIFRVLSKKKNKEISYVIYYMFQIQARA